MCDAGASSFVGLVPRRSEGLRSEVSFWFADCVVSARDAKLVMVRLEPFRSRRLRRSSLSVLQSSFLVRLMILGKGVFRRARLFAKRISSSLSILSFCSGVGLAIRRTFVRILAGLSFFPLGKDASPMTLAERTELVDVVSINHHVADNTREIKA